MYDVSHGVQLPAAQEKFEVYIPNPQVSSTATEAQAGRVTAYYINLHALHKFFCSALYYAMHQSDR